MSISIIIPTFFREEILLETVGLLLELDSPADEILIVDQTPEHDRETGRQLQQWHDAGVINWIRLEKPSIPHAMNVGLQQAKGEVVLFLDDDIIPDSRLIESHRKSHQESDCWAVVGQVLQPWQKPEALEAPRQLKGIRQDFDFPFHSTLPADHLANVMAGNLSVKRVRALEVGGFDENFIGAAYRFETEFARRIVRAGGQIKFEPLASIKHLRVSSGGTRSRGDHRASADPRHGVGDYYFAMKQGLSIQSISYMGYRMIREVCTKFHLKYPWYIPVKLLGEVRALIWAFQMNSSQLKQKTLVAGKTSSSS